MSTKKKIPWILMAIAIFLVGVCAFIVSADTHVPSTTKMNTVVGNVSNRLSHVSSISGGAFTGWSTTTRVNITNNYTGISSAVPAIQGTTTKGNSPGVTGTGKNIGVLGYGTGAGGSRGVYGYSLTGYGVFGQGGIYGGYFSGGGGLYGSTVVSGDGKFNGSSPAVIDGNGLVAQNPANSGIIAETPFNVTRRHVYNCDTTVRVLIIGDSTGSGATLSDPTQCWPGQLAQKFNGLALYSSVKYYQPTQRTKYFSGYSQTVNLRTSTKGRKFILRNASVNGSTMENWTTSANWNPMVKNVEPRYDAAIIYMGHNNYWLPVDTQIADIQTVINRLNRDYPGIEILISTQNVHSGVGNYELNANYAARSAAVQFVTGFMDTQKVVAWADPTNAWVAGDGVHPNLAGHTEVANIIWPLFSKWAVTPAPLAAKLPFVSNTSIAFRNTTSSLHKQVAAKTSTTTFNPYTTGAGARIAAKQPQISTRDRGAAEATFKNTSGVGFYGTFFGPHSIPSGTTFPASPASHQLFVLTNPGSRTWMFWYDSSSSTWIPIESSGTTHVYVDSANGTDDPSHGYGSGTAAYKTLTYMHSQIPPILYGSVLVDTSGTFRELYTCAGKYFATSGCTFTLQGAWTMLLADTVATSAAARTSATASASITKTGAWWTADAYKGKILYITSGTGAGQYLPILTNTTNTIYVESWSWHYATPDSTSHFVVYDWTTKITGSDNDSTPVRAACVEVGMDNVKVQNLELTMATTNNVLCDAGVAGLVVQYNNIHDPAAGRYDVQLVSCIAPTVQCNYIHGGTNGIRLIGCLNATAEYDWLSADYGILAGSGTYITPWGNRFDTCASYGLWLSNASGAGTVASNATLSDSFVSCATGISVSKTTNCYVADAANQYYSSCTTNYSGITKGGTVTLTDTSTVTVDMTTGNYFSFSTAGRAVTINAVTTSSCPAGTMAVFHLVEGNGGSYTFGTGFSANGTVTPTVGYAIDVTFIYTGSTWRETRRTTSY